MVALMHECSISIRPGKLFFGFVMETGFVFVTKRSEFYGKNHHQSKQNEISGYDKIQHSFLFINFTLLSKASVKSLARYEGNIGRWGK